MHLPAASLGSPVLSVHSAVCGSACGLSPEAVRRRRGETREGQLCECTSLCNSVISCTLATHCILRSNSSISLAYSFLQEREKYTDPYFAQGHDIHQSLTCVIIQPHAGEAETDSASDLVSLRDASIPFFIEIKYD